MNLNLMDAELRRDEGVRYVEYPDSVGIPTTGVGHNLRASPLPTGWTYPLSDAQVNQLLNTDLDETFSGLDVNLSWWRSLDEVRQRVIANMCFNMGIGKLMGFHNTLLAMSEGNYMAAAAGMKNSIWYHQVGARGVRLVAAMQTGMM